MPALMIHHVDLAVSDVDRTIDFYKAVLGPLGLGSHVRPVTDGEGDENFYPTYRGTEDGPPTVKRSPESGALLLVGVICSWG